ncbi:MAG TPA: NAD(P)-dependent oxidoreductase [Patescibacteria group bacterium]|nr:NAD(P)-dependent oxidoreductase [Patescibacteria group bacterium]
MKVLITGGTGFLGVHLARKFLRLKWDVTLFDLADLDAKDLIGKVKVIKGNVNDKTAVTKALKGQDYVVHAAAALPIQFDKETIFRINIDGTKNVLDAALKNKIKRLVYISSTAVYGVPKHLPETEESPLDPIGYYGISKITGEKLCQEFMKKGLEINIIRPKTFLGIERLGVFSLWFEAIYNSRKLYILGQGNNKYQLLAVTDVAEAVQKALVSSAKNEIFNIGAKDFGTWRSDLSYVIKKEKSKAVIISLPVLPSQMILALLEQLNLSPIAAWHYKTMPVPSYVSIAKAEKLLHWHPKKSNKELFLESYDWYKLHRNEIINRQGKTHRVNWNFKILNLVSKF